MIFWRFGTGIRRPQIASQRVKHKSDVVSGKKNEGFYPEGAEDTEITETRRGAGIGNWD